MNIDIVLFAGRIVLVALLYIFLFAVMKTGVGLVRGQRRDSAIWTIDVDKGPRGMQGYTYYIYQRQEDARHQ